MKRYIQFLGLGRATFFIVWVGFRACSFGTGRAQVTGNWLISGHNMSNSGHFWAEFGPLLCMNNGNKIQKMLF